MTGSPSYSKRISGALREEIHERGACWVDAEELERRVSPDHRGSYRVRLASMVREGDVRVDRSRGRGRFRYALFTPPELEVILTQFVIAGRSGFEAVYRPGQSMMLTDPGPKTTTSSSLVSTPS